MRYYDANWSSASSTPPEHWAVFGRQAVAGMKVNTNNHLERFNGIFKYVFLQRKKSRSLQLLLKTIVGEVMTHYLTDRLKKLAGLQRSGKLITYVHNRVTEGTVCLHRRQLLAVAVDHMNAAGCLFAEHASRRGTTQLPFVSQNPRWTLLAALGASA
jgi:hypothetical protein